MEVVTVCRYTYDVLPPGKIVNTLREVPKGETMRGKESTPLHYRGTSVVSNNNLQMFSVFISLLYSKIWVLCNILCQ